VRLAVASPASHHVSARGTPAPFSALRASSRLADAGITKVPHVSALSVWIAQGQYQLLREALELRLRSVLRRIPRKPHIPPSPHCKKYKRHRARLRQHGVRTWRLLPFTHAWPRHRCRFVRLSHAAQRYLLELSRLSRSARRAAMAAVERRIARAKLLHSTV
jgi:hypothetical protein